MQLSINKKAVPKEVRLSTQDQERFLEVAEFAKLVRVTPKTIYRHAKNIPHVRIGGRIRFDMESPALQQWLTSTKQEVA